MARMYSPSTLNVLRKMHRMIPKLKLNFFLKVWLGLGLLILVVIAVLNALQRVE
jgi:hypothetical protein